MASHQSTVRCRGILRACHQPPFSPLSIQCDSRLNLSSYILLREHPQWRAISRSNFHPHRKTACLIVCSPFLDCPVMSEGHSQVWTASLNNEHAIESGGGKFARSYPSRAVENGLPTNLRSPPFEAPDVSCISLSWERSRISDLSSTICASLM